MLLYEQANNAFCAQDGDNISDESAGWWTNMTFGEELQTFCFTVVRSCCTKWDSNDDGWQDVKGVGDEIEEGMAITPANGGEGVLYVISDFDCSELFVLLLIVTLLLCLLFVLLFAPSDLLW